MPNILTFAELKKTTEVYDNFAPIDQCNIPNYYKEQFPKTCECGAEMIMTKMERTQLQCCNPGCWIKMGHRLAYFISKLGYKGFGDESALTLVSRGRSYFKYPTFLSAFLLSDTEVNMCLSEYYADLFCEIRDDLKERPFHFPDAISALGIPNIGSRSAFFDVVKSPVVLMQYSLQGRTDEICDAAGIQASMTRYQLKLFKLDILTLMKDVMPHIMDTPNSEIYIAITGKVSVDGVSYTRQEFIALCESIQDARGQQQYKIVETKAESKLEYVIADSPSSSDKYTLGLRLNRLITAKEFYDELCRRAGTVTTESEETASE